MTYYTDGATRAVPAMRSIRANAFVAALFRMLGECRNGS